MTRRKITQGERIGISGVVVAILVGIFAHYDARSQTESPKSSAISSGAPQSPTLSGSGTVTNATANGQSNQISNGNTTNSNNAPQNITVNGSPPLNPPPGNEMTVTESETIRTVNIVRTYHITPKAKIIPGPPKKMVLINFLFEEGVTDIKHGQYDAAISANSQVLIQSVRDAGAYNNRAIAYFAIQNLEAAISNWKVATKLDPGNPDYYLNLSNGLSRYAVGRADAKQIVIDSIHQSYLALGVCGNDPIRIEHIWSNIAGAYLQIGAVAAAKEANTKAFANNPFSAEAHLDHALILSAAGESNEVQILSEILYASRLNPDDPAPYWKLAQYYAFSSQPDRDKAYMYLVKALSADPTYAVNFRNPAARWDLLCNESRFRAIIIPAQQKH